MSTSLPQGTSVTEVLHASLGLGLSPMAFLHVAPFFDARIEIQQLAHQQCPKGCTSNLRELTRFVFSLKCSVGRFQRRIVLATPSVPNLLMAPGTGCELRLTEVKPMQQNLLTHFDHRFQAKTPHLIADSRYRTCRGHTMPALKPCRVTLSCNPCLRHLLPPPDTSNYNMSLQWLCCILHLQGK